MKKSVKQAVIEILIQHEQGLTTTQICQELIALGIHSLSWRNRINEWSHDWGVEYTTTQIGQGQYRYQLTPFGRKKAQEVLQELYPKTCPKPAPKQAEKLCLFS